MAILDIREPDDSSITEIVFADDNYVTKDSCYIVLCDRTDETEFYIKSEVIPDLIKALLKAGELGWTE